MFLGVQFFCDYNLCRKQNTIFHIVYPLIWIFKLDSMLLKILKQLYRFGFPNQGHCNLICLALINIASICQQKKQQKPSLQHITSVDNYHSITALNKSPSIAISNFPPCNSVKLFAIARPKPLPSVFRETSPRTKRSVRSVG